MKNMKKTIGVVVLSVISSGWAVAWSPWIICGGATHKVYPEGGGGPFDQTSYYSARCPDGKAPEGFTCAYHPTRFVNVIYINNVGGKDKYYDVSQDQMNTIDKICEKIDKSAKAEDPAYLAHRQGDNGGGMYGHYYDFRVVSNKSSFFK
ncbi:hypothetical protein [Piscirickettsia salmonis]|uniref:hypothetical protein n=1 Tax=Piscirickettsia salmonis TaxID=1238 RepID=UPI0007D7715F|nr:hypothetical protein A0O36_02688 [Piscirickettsiaceae bacterium NZ-RLO1]